MNPSMYRESAKAGLNQQDDQTGPSIHSFVEVAETQSLGRESAEDDLNLRPVAKFKQGKESQYGSYYHPNDNQFTYRESIGQMQTELHQEFDQKQLELRAKFSD